MITIFCDNFMRAVQKVSLNWKAGKNPKLKSARVFIVKYITLIMFKTCKTAQIETRTCFNIMSMALEIYNFSGKTICLSFFPANPAGYGSYHCAELDGYRTRSLAGVVSQSYHCSWSKELCSLCSVILSKIVIYLPEKLKI